MNERLLKLQALRDQASRCVRARRLRSRLMRDGGMLALAAGLSLSEIRALEAKFSEWSDEDIHHLERGESFLDTLKRFEEAYEGVGKLDQLGIQH